MIPNSLENLVESGASHLRNKCEPNVFPRCREAEIRNKRSGISKTSLYFENFYRNFQVFLKACSTFDLVLGFTTKHNRAPMPL